MTATTPSWIYCLLFPWLFETGSCHITQPGWELMIMYPRLASSSQKYPSWLPALARGLIATLLPFFPVLRWKHASPCLVPSWVFSSQTFPTQNTVQGLGTGSVFARLTPLAHGLKPPNLFCVCCVPDLG